MQCLDLEAHEYKRLIFSVHKKSCGIAIGGLIFDVKCKRLKKEMVDESFCKLTPSDVRNASA